MYIWLSNVFVLSIKEIKSLFSDLILVLLMVYFFTVAVVVAAKGAKPEPGCEIIVPSKKRRNPINLANLATMGTTLASLATLIIAITKL